MKTGQLRNLRTGQIVGERIWKADSFWTRFKGLLGRSSVGLGEGLWLIPCQQVHMFGMQFPISVYFIDKSGCVCGVVEELRPWGISPHVKKSVSVLEFPVGWGKSADIKMGDKLVWEDSSVIDTN
jgi:uncharacterized membrane protein (UPF0127 family)